MKKDKLYIIRGTGLSLDGQVVKVVEVVGDYSVVSPPNLDSVHNTMVKTKCIQEIKDTSTYFYRIIVQRWKTDDPRNIDQLEVDIPNSIRNVRLETITEYLDTNLRPILRME